MESKESRYTIKDYPCALRPRERMEQMGAEALSDRELLALLLSTGTREHNALELADIVLTECGGVKGMASLSLAELAQFKGVGQGKGARILAALELGKRMSLAAGDYRPQINSSSEAANLLMDDMRHLEREVFKIILLNTKNKVLSIETIALGSLNQAAVEPREVFRVALKKNAYAMIVAHNHPSGDSEPSDEDCQLTERLQLASELIGIPILDHIIIGEYGYMSFREKNLMSLR